MGKPTDMQRKAALLEAEISTAVEDQLWNGYYGNTCPSGFVSEDPTLTGRSEDGDDGLGVVLVNAKGERFLVETQIFVSDLPPLHEDPDYIKAHPGPEPVPVDPNQLELL